MTLLSGCAGLGRRLLLFAPSAGARLGGTQILAAGLKIYQVPADYSGITIPERQRLKFYDKAPNVQKVVKEKKNLNDIRGPYDKVEAFTEGQYGIVALGGGYLRWGHFEMMRLTINRSMDSKTMFAIWRVNAPYKPVTRKGLGQRMGGGKGTVDHYVTPVKCGQLVVEVGGYCEFGEVEPFLTVVAKKLPFLAKTVSRQTLAEMQEEERRREEDNQNPWSFERIARANMMGCRKVLSPYDLQYKGRYRGKFKLPDRA